MLDIKNIASKVISDRLQHDINILNCKELYNRRISNIYRLQDEQGYSYILKALKSLEYKAAFNNDYIGLEMNNTYLQDQEDLFCPKLYGLSDDMQIIVMSEIKGESFRDIILKKDYRYAKEVNIKKVETLADMHLKHLKNLANYTRLKKYIGLKTNVDSGYFNGAFDQLKANMYKIKIRWSTDLKKELNTLNNFFDPKINNLYSFTHGDLSDDNVYISGGAVKFIDFEKCAYRPMLTDIYFNRMTVGYEIPEDVLIELENTYRKKLSKSFKEILNDEFYNQQLVCSGAFHALKFLVRDIFQQNPHDSYGKKRMNALQSFARLSEANNVLPSLGELVRKIIAQLKKTEEV